MELKEFVKKVIIDLDQAVSEANNETKREIKFKGVKEQRNALEFDVAVTVESKNKDGAGGEIKVWGIVQGGIKTDTESNTSTVSRVRFGIDIGERTKAEVQENKTRIENENSSSSEKNPAL